MINPDTQLKKYVSSNELVSIYTSFNEVRNNSTKLPFLANYGKYQKVKQLLLLLLVFTSKLSNYY